MHTKVWIIDPCSVIESSTWRHHNHCSLQTKHKRLSEERQTWQEHHFFCLLRDGHFFFTLSCSDKLVAALAFQLHRVNPKLKTESISIMVKRFWRSLVVVVFFRRIGTEEHLCVTEFWIVKSSKRKIKQIFLTTNVILVNLLGWDSSRITSSQTTTIITSNVFHTTDRKHASKFQLCQFKKYCWYFCDKSEQVNVMS